MQEIDVREFLRAPVELRRLNTVLENARQLGANPEQDLVQDGVAKTLLDMLSGLMTAVEPVGARATRMAAGRLQAILKSASPLTVAKLTVMLGDIESRFADEVSFCRLYLLSPERTPLLEPPEVLLGAAAAATFPSCLYDIEEAAKSIAVGRSTAAVFHSMRAMEVGIRALAKRIGIADPTKPAERNWGFMLRAIKEKIDADYPSSSRTKGTEGAFFEGLYATLDAVKNPLRNATMHVENVYTEEEAYQILRNVAGFIQCMTQKFDENGEIVQLDPAILSTARCDELEGAIGNPGA